MATLAADADRDAAAAVLVSGVLADVVTALGLDACRFAAADRGGAKLVRSKPGRVNVEPLDEGRCAAGGTEGR